MFKKGDKVVLIDVDGLGDEWVVELYNEYEVDIYTEFIDSNDGEQKSVTILRGVNGAFHGNRFMNLVQFRKQKINKILCSIRETK